MRFWKNCVLFYLGGGAYMLLEVGFRGWSHGSMFLAGGSCFLLLGRLGRSRMKLPLRALTGAGVITGIELLTGLVANRDYSVWDYRNMPMNYRGQICLPFCLLWIPISVFGMLLYRVLDKIVPTDR